jgi:hypothetical protein
VSFVIKFVLVDIGIGQNIIWWKRVLVKKGKVQFLMKRVPPIQNIFIIMVYF